MSTRSIIASTINGQTTGIYCHFDGYPSGVGATLAAHYTTPEKIAALIALGSLSVLAENVAPAEGQAHSFDRKAEGVTVAYHRDRGEEFDGGETKAAEDFMRDPPDFGQDYTYVHDGEQWMIKGCGKWRPLLDVLAESHD